MASMEHRKAFYRTEGKHYRQEAEAEKEKSLIYSYYPKETVLAQAFVEDACDRLDYEGSFIYDEYPDKWQIEAGGILGDPDGDFAVPGNLPKKVQKKSLQKTLVKKRKEVLQNCSFWGCGFPLKLLQ